MSSAAGDRTPRSMSLEIVEDTGRFLGLKDEWEDLLEESDSDCLFLTWEWLSCWWKHLSRDRRLFVATVRERDRLVAVAPLVVRPPGISSLLPFPALEFMGTGSVGSDYLDLIVRRGHEDRALRILADCLAARNRALELEQLRLGGCAISGLGDLLGQQGWHVRAEETNLSRFVRLEGQSWASYQAALGRAHRYNFRRRLRQMERGFDLRFEKVATEDHRRAALGRLIALHHARWRDRGSSNAFHTENHLRFHEEVSRLACRRGWLRIYNLWLDDEPVAALYGFRYKNTFSFYQSGFDPNYSRYSTGLVTMGLTIRSALEEGVSEFDMLQGIENYKSLWARESRPLGRLEFYPPHLRGFVYRGAMGVNRAMRRTARRVLPKAVIGWIADALLGIRSYGADPASAAGTGPARSAGRPRRTRRLPT